MRLADIQSVTIAGVSETRFNPTYGSVFFFVSGGDLADAGRDARITADGRVLPSTRTSVSPRIVAGRYRLAPGPRQLTMTGWDGSGRPLEAEARIWTGELPLLVVVTDFAGRPVRQARATVSLDSQRRVAEDLRRSDRKPRKHQHVVPFAEPHRLQALAVVRGRDSRTGSARGLVQARHEAAVDQRRVAGHDGDPRCSCRPHAAGHARQWSANFRVTVVDDPAAELAVAVMVAIGVDQHL